ncbi:MAG TPA: ABC transporter permease [Blastocatellia bacterium]|nr:ABC transporter permease [Blastocatellia bacterium]
MQTLWQDLRYGLRTLLKNPGFTLVAVVTLALGVGVNTAIFSVVNGVLLRPLPFNQPERIVTLWENNLKDGIERDDVSPANFLDWSERSRSFEEMAFANPWSLDFIGETEPETWRATRVSQGFFRILGAQAIVGRTFLPEEYETGRNQVVVLSYGLWRRRFGAEPGVVGRKLTLDGQPMTVVGVMPPEFKLRLFDREEELWWPQTPDESMRRQRRATYLKVIARLKPGVSVEQARAEMSSIAANLASEYPQTNAGVGATTVTLTEQETGHVRTALLALLAAVAAVLLIACANVANLLLARGNEREREFAIRAAIGAGGARLARQTLTESLLLASLGCGGGLLLAAWGIDLIVAMSPGDIPRLEQVRLDRVTLLFVAGLSFLTALIFGFAPALQFSRPKLSDCLKEASHTATGGSTRRRLRSALVISEIALALALLVGAGLLVRSFFTLLKTDPGFAADKLVALQTFVWDRYGKPEERAAYVQQVTEKMRSAPGVQTVGVTTALPFFESSMDSSYPFTVEGRPAPPVGQEPTAFATIANNDYFAALGAPLLRGRMFSEFDKMGAAPVILINETMGRRHFRDENPIGRKLTVRGSLRGQPTPLTFEIVGVVGDVRHDGLDREPRAEYFRPYAQIPNGSIIFVVRTDVEPTNLLQALKARIWEVNATQPIYAVSVMADSIDASLKSRRFSLWLFIAFAALALALAIVGIYGVMSYSTSQRTHEIGVRMALGAASHDIIKLVMKQGMRLTMAGVAIGLLVSILFTRLMRGLLYGVSATDPLTLVVVSLLLTGVALLSCYAPARRATKVDPMVALRRD